MFEGAQGSLLDIDHGTYPYVTSSNTTAGGTATGSGFGPLYLDYVLGITKAYTTRVGSGPFPDRAVRRRRAYLAKRGHEFGATTGRARRCGWFDAVILRRAIEINSISGLCLTKLDVLDGLDVVRLCVGYKNADGDVLEAPTDADSYIGLQPVYEEMPGWASRPWVRRPWKSCRPTPAPTSSAWKNWVRRSISSPPVRIATKPSSCAIHSPEADSGAMTERAAHAARFHSGVGAAAAGEVAWLEGKNRGQQKPSDARLFVLKMVPRRRLELPRCCHR